MKKLFKTIAIILVAAIMSVVMLFAGCGDPEENNNTTSGGNTGNNSGTNTPVEHVDYVGKLKLSFTNGTKKQEVTVRQFIDGDTTHFNPVENSELPGCDNVADFDNEDLNGYIKARYLAVNTPESTGKIEEWGKKASTFTHSKLEKAKSIVVESDDDKWNIDSTGSRILLWIWYIPEDGTDYVNLNVQILQEGLALGSSTANNRYGDTANAALQQAKAEKLYVFSGEKDPDFFYGTAIPVSMRELCCNFEEYSNKKVAVEGVVVGGFNDSVYVEEYDADSDIYFGIYVYMGASATSSVLNILSVGNRVKIVGTVQYYPARGSYQIAGVTYNTFDKDNENNLKLLSENNAASYRELDVGRLKEDLTFSFVVDEDGVEKTVTKTIKYGDAVMNTSVSLNNLKVKSTYTTHNGGNNDGAISITCETADGKTIVVRTAVLKDASGKTVTESAFTGKTISVKGVVDKYDGEYQVYVYTYSRITFVS